MTPLRRCLLGLAIGAPVLLLVLYTLGALTPQQETGIPTPPLTTLLALPLDMWIRDLATALMIGAIAVGTLLAPAPSAPLLRLARLSAVVWIVALLGQSVLTVSEVLALPLVDAADTTVVMSLLSQTDLGRVLAAQVLLVGLALLLLFVRQGRLPGVMALALVLVAAWLPGLTGHSGMEHSHVAPSIALGLHLVFASLWVGGLVAVVVYIAAGGPAPGTLLRRFSVLALASVIVIAQSGLLNASLHLDGVASLVTSVYGAIILAKTCVLLVLIGWGWRHRRTLADRWDAAMSEGVSRSTLLRWISWEVMWMGIVYGLAVALSRTAPPGFALAGDHLNVGAIVMLLLGVPLALAFINPQLVRAPSFLGSYPEATAVLAVMAVLVAGTWVPSSLSGATVGIQLAALSALVLLVLAGTALVATLRQGSSPVAVALVLVGLPVVVWWIERDVVGGLGVGTWVVVLLAEGLVLWAARSGPRRVDDGEGIAAPESDVEEVRA